MMFKNKFDLVSEFSPAGSQPAAIKSLAANIDDKGSTQTLLGVTGSGKTFTMAQIIAKANRPALVLAHNKTLAAQLYAEFKEFFPNNRVEYFVSFYDYYQPESYMPAKDQYIEKDSQINEEIERMRLAATASLLSHSDTIIVASVSCIYGLGNPKNFLGLGFEFKTKQKLNRKLIISNFVNMQYERNDLELMPGRFRVKGDTIDVIPGYDKNIIRIELFGDEVDRITEIDKNTGAVISSHDYFFLFPARHFLTPEDSREAALSSIKNELEERLPQLGQIESHRLKQRTLYDLEMIEEMGFCKGIENYSRHLEGRLPGQKPYCLLDYFPKGFLLFIDESHASIPQVHGMYQGDKMRKQNLVDYGFRLPSALDNRPLQFTEFEKYIKSSNTIFVSATPSKYELETSDNVAEQIIRPTGLVDPPVEIRPTDNQMEDVLKEIDNAKKRGDRVLITTLTKKLAEELSDYLASVGVRSRYLHSEIKTLERSELIRQLREGKFEVLVGINLLREGLDIPEVSFIGIFDADKEGFLRNASSLIQIIGRAARNVNSHVVMYADVNTQSMKMAMRETARRRKIQVAYNTKHNITPKTIIKKIPAPKVIILDTKNIPLTEKKRLVPQLDKEMKQAAKDLDFELAIALRDQISALKRDVKNKEDEKEA